MPASRCSPGGLFVFPRWNAGAAPGIDGEETAMSKEKPSDDPRQRTDRKSLKQTEEPWKGPVEKEQKPGALSDFDLEKWHSTNTH
jgi:hypothetical protein